MAPGKWSGGHSDTDKPQRPATPTGCHEPRGCRQAPRPLLGLCSLLLLTLTCHLTSIQLANATTARPQLSESQAKGEPPLANATQAPSPSTITAAAAHQRSHQPQKESPEIQAAGSDGSSFGDMVNKSLTLLEQGKAAEARLNQVSLVHELTNLIMNNEPETIGRRVRGVRVSGQMVSESGPTIDDSAPASEFNASAPFNNDQSLLDAGHAAFKEDTMSEAGPLQEVNGQQRFLSLEEAPNSLSEQPVDPFTGQTNASNEEQYVTCPPDYEDQTILEASGNLTAEQRQQLFASVDSSGILSSGNSSSHGSSDPSLRPPASQCVHPGSRMIEMITKVITPILFSIIIVVGLVGNIIVMLVIIEDRKTERELTPTNLLILDLSLADLSFIIFCIPFTGWDYSVGHWVFGLMWCKANQYLIVVCALSSIYTLVLMSVDRFMAIVYPIECISYRTSQNTLYAIYIKWILILLMASPTIPMHGLIDLPLGPDMTTLYTCRFLSDQFNPLQFQIIFFITSYLFPLILIFCLYLSLLKKLWFGSKPHGHKESQKMVDSKKRVTMLVASIVVVFALCWCPIQVMLILMRLKSHKITVTYVAIQVFAHILGYMNSCVNPIVYAFASETFHNSFKRSSIGRIFCCMCCSNQEPERPTVTLTGRNSTQHNNANTTLLNHLGTQQLNQSNCDLRLNTNGSSRHGSLNVCHDSAVSTTTLLMTSCNANHDNVSKIVTLPLEPRDRVLPPPKFGACLTPSNNSVARDRVANRQEQVSSSRETGAIGSVASGDGGGGRDSASSRKRAAAKQQLVVRVVQPSNQISHQCEPCYQQGLIAP